jgi:dephospho-CoA kinase
MDKKKPLIGLTGGIASGKSSVSRVLAGQGIDIVDADQIAREVVAPGSDGLSEIARVFGLNVLRSDGALDREKLGAVVFRDRGARAQLEDITHPRIAARSAERIALAMEGRSPYVVYDAPLLVEVSGYRGMDALIVVAASEVQQVERATARDGMTQDEAKRRIAAQLPLADKVALADYVVNNDRSLAELEAATLDVHARILARFGLGTTEPA